MVFWKKLRDSNLGLFTEAVTYGHCESCGSLGQIPPLTPWRLAKAYPESYWGEGGEDSLLKRLALWYQQQILSLDQGWFVRQVSGPLQGKRILEIGPGRGDFLCWAKAQGAEVAGWERSPQVVAYLRSLGLAAEAVVLEDLSQWPKATEKWDVIAGFHVLEHLTDPLQVVAGLLSHLAPHGLFIIQVPRIDSLQAQLLGDRWAGLDVPRHVSLPTLKGLKRLASRLDLQKLDCRHFSLRDNAFHIMMSLFPYLDPHRIGIGKLELVMMFLGTWCLQPLAVLEALAGKGATVMMAFQRTAASGQ
jgi:SAM-dependent methyltransferase